MSLDYRPDLPPTDASILSTCQFLIPDKSGQYRTSYAASPSGNWTTALTAAITGARMVIKADGTPFAFFGSAGQLQEWNGVTLSNVSQGGGSPYTSGSNRWWFEQYGDVTVASNYANNTQSRSGATGSAFADLSGAPKAKFFLSQSNYLLACNYDDGSAAPNGIKWATEGSSTSWTPSASNTAGNATLRQSPGPIVAGAQIHDIVAIWKKTSMYVGKRIGGLGTNVWEFNLLSPKIGCVSQEAWVTTPVGIIFVSPYNGVFRFDGSVPVPIDNGIRQDIYRNIGTLASVQMSHDEASCCVFIWTSGNNHYCYNYITDKWSRAYAGSVLGNASFTTFVAAVRDATYDDYSTISGDSNSQRRAHLVVSSEKKVCNLSSYTANGSLNARIVVPTVRDPKAGPWDESVLVRVTPVWGFDQETIGFVEPASGTCTVKSRARVSSTTTLDTATLSLDSSMRFDGLRAANSFNVAFDFVNQVFVLADVLYETGPAGKR